MSKAIQGAAMLAGAVGLGAVAFFTAGIASPALLGYLLSTSAALGLGGVAMEAGAIADALTSNRGTNISTRQAAAARQIIYGNQRVGGVIVYASTTGSTHRQYNMIIVLAGHEVEAIHSLYLDGRLVVWDVYSAGHSVRNGVHFGGNAAGGDHTGPDGQTYNFDGKVYCEARFGDQVPGDYITGLTANDPNWAPRNGRSPYLGGCAYVYLKVEYDENTFPSLPEIRFNVFGKRVWDPRTGQTAYSANWALIAADIIRDAQFGLGDDSVNEAQLIAAANVCDELVPLAKGLSESRYTCHMHYDTSTAPSDALANMMNGAAGRLSRIGGEWYIWPAYWQGPSFSFDQSVLTGPVKWEPQRGLADRFNRVTGTYTAASYPYNVAGNEYDGDGLNSNNQSQDNFQFGFQPTNFPQYAKDVLHGYANDQYLAEDFNIVLPREISLNMVLSVAQAQRVAKIELMRNREQGSGTLEMGLAAYSMQPCDVMNFTFPFLGWSNKVLEIAGTRFEVQQGTGDADAPALRASFDVQETAASVYEWSTSEELTVYDAPAASTGAAYSVGPPTNMLLVSSAATALTQPDGSVVPRILVTWDTPEDGYVVRIAGRYRVSGTSTWIDAGTVDALLNQMLIGGVVAGQTYDVQIRSQRANGGSSVWVEVDAFTAGLVLSASGNDQRIGVGSLVGEAYADGTAGIDCKPFSATIGSRSLSYFPSGTKILTGLQQQSFYYVYLVDSALAGGDVTPVATLDKADFLGKVGYFLIDTIVTPYVVSSGPGATGQRYRPSGFQDVGSRTTQVPDAAYDGDASSCATVSGQAGSNGISYGSCIFQGDPNIALTADSTLTIIAAVTITNPTSGGAGFASISATFAGATHSLLSASVSSGQTTYTLNIPAGTTLSSVAVQVTANAAAVYGSGSILYQPAQASVDVYDVYIQS